MRTRGYPAFSSHFRQDSVVDLRLGGMQASDEDRQCIHQHQVYEIVGTGGLGCLQLGVCSASVLLSTFCSFSLTVDISILRCLKHPPGSHPSTRHAGTIALEFLS